MGKSASLIRVGLAYVVAMAVAAVWLAWGPDTRWLWLDALIADVLATIVVFAFSRIYRNSSCYDPYWSVLPPFFVVAWWVIADHHGVRVDHTRAVLLTTVVFVWAIRLTANWVQDWPGMEREDWRYPMLREKAGRLGLVVDFLGVHLFPTLIVFLALVPAYAVVALPGRSANWLDWLALAIGIAAPTLQFISDAQMRSFIRVRAPGQAMDRGLWALSRHPNYFGEVSFWVALALFGIAGAPRDWWWLALGAVAMIAMFEGASIPMMEQRSLERRPSYQEIIDRVPRLVPRVVIPIAVAVLAASVAFVATHRNAPTEEALPYAPLPAAATNALGVTLKQHDLAAHPIRVISVKAALAAAKQRAPGLVTTAKSITVSFGDFSDAEYATVPPDSPAFVVTYNGVSMRSLGRSNAVDTEASVVVNATTGAIIEEFSYR